MPARSSRPANGPAAATGRSAAGRPETEIDGTTQTAAFGEGQYFNAGPARIPQHHTTLDYCRELGVPIEIFANANADAWYYNEAANGAIGPLTGQAHPPPDRQSRLPRLRQRAAGQGDQPAGARCGPEPPTMPCAWSSSCVASGALGPNDTVRRRRAARVRRPARRRAAGRDDRGAAATCPTCSPASSASTSRSSSNGTRRC